MQKSVLNKQENCGVKMLWRYTDMAIFVLRCFILTHPVLRRFAMLSVATPPDIDMSALAGERCGRRACARVVYDPRIRRGRRLLLSETRWTNDCECEQPSFLRSRSLVVCSESWKRRHRLPSSLVSSESRSGQSRSVIGYNMRHVLPTMNRPLSLITPLLLIVNCRPILCDLHVSFAKCFPNQT